MSTSLLSPTLAEQDLIVWYNLPDPDEGPLAQIAPVPAFDLPEPIQMQEAA